MAGLGSNTIKRVRTIEQKAFEETKEKFRTQEISINQAYKEIKKEERLPSKKLDPQHSKINPKGRKKHYVFYAFFTHFIKKAPYITYEALSVARTGIEPVTSGL